MFRPFLPCVRSAVGGELSTARRVRCAVFLLQLLSNIFKTERGASHPERTNHASASEFVTLQRDSESEACEFMNECARVINEYLGKMVQAATALRVRGQSGDPNADHVTGNLDAEDAGYWMLALLSDVLKYLRKDKWSCGGSSSPTTGYKRQRDAQARGHEVVSASRPSSTALAEAMDAPEVGEGGSSELVVDFSSMAKMVAAYPLGRSNGTMDVALKWLEVTKASVFPLLAK